MTCRTLVDDQSDSTSSPTATQNSGQFCSDQGDAAEDDRDHGDHRAGPGGRGPAVMDVLGRVALARLLCEACCCGACHAYPHFRRRVAVRRLSGRLRCSALSIVSPDVRSYAHRGLGRRRSASTVGSGPASSARQTSAGSASSSTAAGSAPVRSALEAPADAAPPRRAMTTRRPRRAPAGRRPRRPTARRCRSGRTGRPG